MPRAPRCAYQEGRARCKRAGDGNPPLCTPHRLVLEQAARETPSVGQAVGRVLGKFFRGERLTRDDVGAAFVDGVSMFTGVPPEAYRQGGIDPSRGQPPGQSRIVDWAYEQLKAREARARAEGPAPKRKPDGPDPRVVLGWKKGEKVTVEQVTARRRELAKKHHPDKKGGSVEKMQQVNAAADQLLAELGG